jgi:hypothetical protein
MYLTEIYIFNDNNPYTIKLGTDEVNSCHDNAIYLFLTINFNFTQVKFDFVYYSFYSSRVMSLSSLKKCQINDFHAVTSGNTNYTKTYLGK